MQSEEYRCDNMRIMMSSVLGPKKNRSNIVFTICDIDFFDEGQMNFASFETTSDAIKIVDQMQIIKGQYKSVTFFFRYTGHMKNHRASYFLIKKRKYADMIETSNHPPLLLSDVKTTHAPLENQSLIQEDAILYENLLQTNEPATNKSSTRGQTEQVSRDGASRVSTRILSYDVGIRNLAEIVLEVCHDGRIYLTHMKRIDLLAENDSKTNNCNQVTTDTLTQYLVDYLFKHAPVTLAKPIDKIIIERQPGLNRKITTMAFVLKSFYYTYYLLHRNATQGIVSVGNQQFQNKNMGSSSHHDARIPVIKFQDSKLKLNVFADYFINPSNHHQVRCTSDTNHVIQWILQQPEQPEQPSVNKSATTDTVKKKRKKKTTTHRIHPMDGYRANKLHAIQQVDKLMDTHQGFQKMKTAYYALGEKRDDIGDAILQALWEIMDRQTRKNSKKRKSNEIVVLGNNDLSTCSEEHQESSEEEECIVISSSEEEACVV